MKGRLWGERQAAQAMLDKIEAEIGPVELLSNVVEVIQGTAIAHDDTERYRSDYEYQHNQQ